MPDAPVDDEVEDVGTKLSLVRDEDGGTSHDLPEQKVRFQLSCLDAKNHRGSYAAVDFDIRVSAVSNPATMEAALKMAYNSLVKFIADNAEELILSSRPVKDSSFDGH